MKAAIGLVLTLILFGAWSNDGKSKSISNLKFGTHDYIAYEGYMLAKGSANLKFIRENFNAFLISTEAPDVGAPTEINEGSGYKGIGYHSHQAKLIVWR